MGIMIGMFLFAFHVFSTQKCEAIIFPKFELACIPARPLGYLDTLFLHRACVPCMHVCDVHSRCDVTTLTYDVNHVIIMSLAFVFHSSHVGMRWYDVIGVHISCTPHHHGSLCLSMM